MPDVLRRVRPDAPVEVREPVETANGGEAAVDGGGGQATLLEGSSVELDVWTGGFQYRQTDVCGPLEEAAEVLAVGVEVGPL
jgi:hypothetical protein